MGGVYIHLRLPSIRLSIKQSRPPSSPIEFQKDKKGKKKGKEKKWKKKIVNKEGGGGGGEE